MSYLYFGQDGEKYFADDEAGRRSFMSHEDWLTVIEMASVPSPGKNERVKLSVREEIKVEIYEDGALKRTVNLSPDITEI